MDKAKYIVDAAKFKSARKRAGFTVQELSNQANDIYTKKFESDTKSESNGFSVSTIQSYEKGGASINEDKLAIIKGLLKVSAFDLVTIPNQSKYVTDRIDFKVWRVFIGKLYDIYRGAIFDMLDKEESYSVYMRQVFSGCALYWDMLSSRAKIDDNGEKAKAKKDDTGNRKIYNISRQVGLKKKDFKKMNEVLKTLEHSYDEAFVLFVREPNIMHFLKDQIPRHRKMIDGIKLLDTLAESKKLNILDSYFAEIISSIQDAETEVLDSFDDSFDEIRG